MNTDKTLKRAYKYRAYVALTAVVFALLSTPLRSDPVGNIRADALISQSAKSDAYQESSDSKSEEKTLDGWAVSFDNDILVPASRDQDYTYGIALTLAGSKVTDYWATPFRPLGWLNKKLGIERLGQSSQSALEFGAYGFTPEDISVATPNPEDRPFASLIYASAIQDFDASNPNVSWRSSLTIGVLGLDFVGDAQNAVHDLTGSQRAEGWGNQISDGGEITARFSLARQQLVPTRFSRLELKTTAQASVGYLTEVSYGVSARFGRLASGWKSSNPGLATYREQANQSVGKRPLSERFWTFGAAVRARAYNVFLEGQFRDSVVEFDRDELNVGILEAWAGYTFSIKKKYSFSYLLRAQSSEVREGIADRNLIWGGITFSRVFSKQS